ncbi:MAG: PspC domain-containing protein [Alistipes sp.]
MKETVNVNIGSQAFTLDQDAYRMLTNYLNNIKSCLPENDTESMGDIETRIAEIFNERISSHMLVITCDTVRATMAQMGNPSDFGEKRDSETSTDKGTSTPRKLYRSRSNRSIAGLCGGIAEFFDTDPTLIRLITLLLIFCGGLSIWIYIILWIAIPKEPIQKFQLTNKNK